jgi:hypothetical protein
MIMFETVKELRQNNFINFCVSAFEGFESKWRDVFFFFYSLDSKQRDGVYDIWSADNINRDHMKERLLQFVFTKQIWFETVFTS